MFKKIKILTSNPLFSGSMILIVGSMFVNALNLVYQFLMADLLKPAGYGILGSLYSILYILSVVPMSSSVSIVKFISSAKTSKERAQIYQGLKKFVFKLALTSSLGVIILSPIVANFLKIDNVFSVILTAGVLFFSLLALVNQASLQGIFDFSGVVIPNFVVTVTKLVLGIILIILGFSVGGAMAAVVMGSFFAYLISQKITYHKFVSTSKEKFILRPFLKYSGPVLVQSLAFVSLFTVDIILAKHFLSEYEAGLYTALSTLGKIVYFGASPVAQVMFPHISKKHANNEKYLSILLASLGLTVLICGFAVLGFVVFPELIFKILLPKYLGAKDYLFWMGLFIAFHTIGSLLVNFSLSINKTKIVIVPLIFAILQIVLITIYHQNILQIIQISLVEMLVMCVILGLWLGKSFFRS